MATMDKDGQTSNADPFELSFSLALEKDSAITRSSAVKACVVWLLLFHLNRPFHDNLSFKICPS